MNESITQEDNLILQSYYMVVLLKELGSNNFFGSDYFTGMNFDSLPVKEGLRQVGIDNQGSALMALYAMLVIPKELIQKTYPNEYENINSFLRRYTVNTRTSYPDEDAKAVSTIKFINHIRNAVVHARVGFIPHETIAFKDVWFTDGSKTNIKAEFTTELPLCKLGDFLNELQKVQLKYIEDRRSSSKE